MLTKQERAAIAARLRDITVFDHYGFYEAVTGELTSVGRTHVENEWVISNVILDLCDASNMMELPLDKDGKVIHIGDTVYVGDREFTVNGLTFNDSNVTVRVLHTKLSALNFYKPNELTHKKPVTIESLVSEIRHTISKSTVIDRETISKLWGITEQLEKLGDGDD